MKNIKRLYSLSSWVLVVCLMGFLDIGFLQGKVIEPALKTEITPLESSESVKLDGRLLEPIWQRAIPIGSLTMVEPDEGGAPTEETEVCLAATLNALYIGIMCYDREPDRIVSHTMKRDAELRGEDHIKIVFDTFLNGRTGYVFAVNPNGARYDALITQEGERENKEWDGIWEAATHKSDEGWSVEIYIPIKTLRFQTRLSRWGFNAERRIQRLLETDRWANPNRNFKVTHVSQAGQITGIPAFEQGLGLTIRPYVRGDRIKESQGEPFENTGTAGLDVMKNFGGNVTGLLSLNTDFAETEVDTRRVNLTRFPLFFPEKRTFFLEGSDIYEFGLGMGFHHTMDLIPFFSRRIGLVEAEVAPLDVSIKATGGVSRFSFGALDVVTRPVDDLAPRANLLAARGYQNIWRESKLGFIVTAGDPLGRNGSYQVGADFVYKTSRFQGDKNFLVGVWGLVTDREDLGSDRTAFGVAVDFPNDLWDISFNAKRIGADFDPSLGFVPWQGIYKVRFGLAYKPRPDWSWLRQMWYEWFSDAVWDVNGQIYKWSIFTAPLNWHLESGDRVEINIYPNYERIPERFDLTDEVYIEAGEYNWIRYRLELQSASKRKVSAKISWWFGTWYDGTMDQIQVTANWRPSHHVNLAIEGERDLVRVASGNADIQLARARIDFFITPNFQLLNYVQFDNQTESLGLNCRLRWTYRSLLDVFVVYNRNWLDMNRMWVSDLNQFLIKIQYSWRH